MSKLNYEDLRTENKVPLSISIDYSLDTIIRKVCKDKDIKISTLLNHILKKEFASEVNQD